MDVSDPKLKGNKGKKGPTSCESTSDGSWDGFVRIGSLSSSDSNELDSSEGVESVGKGLC